MIAELFNELNVVASGLSSRGALNYSVDFGLFPAPKMAENQFQKIVERSLGPKARLGGSHPSSASEVASTLRAALEYCGDDGSHPNLEYVNRIRASGRVEDLVQRVESLVADADLIADIWLLEGHPFCPVFWDFSFIVSFDQDSLIIVGASSD